MGYSQLVSGVHLGIPSRAIYQLETNADTNVFLTVHGDTGASGVYDESYNLLGRTPYGYPIQIDQGTYIVDAQSNGTYRSLSVYIPSYESFANLQPIVNGTYKATSYDNFYRMMLEGSGVVFVSASGDNAKAQVYDENLNFVAHATSKPLYLEAGNYIVIASYNGYKNGELNVISPDEIFADFDKYQLLHDKKVLDGDNYFEGAEFGKVDIVHGLDGDDTFLGRDDGWTGEDRFFGGNGVDISIYRGKWSDYKLSFQDFARDPLMSNTELLNGIVVADSVKQRDGTDFLSEVERLQFSDMKVALDIDGNAGKVAKILASVFGAAAVSNEEYAGIGLNLIDGGMSYEALSALAINAAGAHTREAVVDLLWTNLMGSHPNAEQAKPYIDMLATDLSNVGDLGVIAANYAATIGVVNLDALSQTGLEYI